MKSSDIKRAIKVLKNIKPVEMHRLVFFAYCSKHKKVHSNQVMNKGCFHNFNPLSSMEKKSDN